MFGLPLIARAMSYPRDVPFNDHFIVVLSSSFEKLLAKNWKPNS